MVKEFKGSYPVMITPMDNDQHIDWDGLKNNVEFYLEHRASGLIPVGSTGEYLSLTKEERYDVAEKVIDQVNGRVPVIVGVTSESTRATVEYAKQAESAGADGIMVANSYYYKPTEEEIFKHYYTINENVDLPIMVYNIPSMTGVDMSEELLIKLGVELPHVTHIKEASGNLQKLRNIKLKAGGHVELFCGCEDLALESFFVGATGWVSVAGNMIPNQAQKLYELAVEQKDFENAWKLYDEMLPLLDFIERSGKLVQVTKNGMDLIGQAGGPPRVPRHPLTSQEKEILKNILDKIEVNTFH